MTDTPMPITVTIAEPTTRNPNVWRVLADRELVARLHREGEDRWRIQHVGKAITDGVYFLPEDAANAAGFRLKGTPTAEAAHALNAAATFLPYDGTNDTLPCVEIAGVQVYVYIDPRLGVLRVSIDTETGELPTRDDGSTPMAICVNEALVFDDTSPDGTDVDTTRYDLHRRPARAFTDRRVGTWTVPDAT